MLEDVERLEENPHRVREIGQAPVREGVRGQKIAEFIVNQRHGDGINSQAGHAQQDRRSRNRENGQFLSERKSRTDPLDGRKYAIAQSRSHAREKKKCVETNPILLVL